MTDPLNVRFVPFEHQLPGHQPPMPFTGQSMETAGPPFTYATMTANSGFYSSGVILNRPVLLQHPANQTLFRSEVPAPANERPVYDLSRLPPEFQNFLAICAYRAGVSKIRTALSLDEIRANPKKFEGQTLEFSLYDIDGTICLGQRWVYWLLLDLIRFDPGVVKSLFDLKLATTIMKGAKELLVDDLLLGKELNRDFSQKIIKLALKNIGEKGLKESFERFTSQFGFIRLSPFVVEQILRDAEKGRVPILISAGPEALAIPLAKGLGIHASNVRGTQFTFDPKTGNVTEVNHLHSESKVTGTDSIQGVDGILKELRGEPYKRLGINVTVRKVFTDSGSDKPMGRVALREGGEVFATNPSSHDFIEWVRGGHLQDPLLANLPDAIRSAITTYVIHEEIDGRQIEMYGSHDRSEAFHAGPIPLPASGRVLEIRKYARAAASTATGLAVGALPHLVHHADVKHTLAAANSIAVGAISAMACGFFLPDRGTVSASRDLLLRDVAPLSFFTGAAILFGFMDQPQWIPWMLSTLVASLLARLMTGLVGALSHGLGASKLNRALDRRSDSGTGIRRALQVWIYQKTIPLLTRSIENLIYFLNHFLR